MSGGRFGPLPDPDVEALCDYVDAAGKLHSAAYSVDAVRAILSAELVQFRALLQEALDADTNDCVLGIGLADRTRAVLKE